MHLKRQAVSSQALQSSDRCDVFAPPREPVSATSRCRQGKFKDATKFYNDAKKGAQDDKRLDLMWPAQRGLGRSLWLQAAQEKDPKKALTLREQAVANYRESLGTIETLRQGSLRADESRTTFLASIKDVFDEAAAANAAIALMTNPAAGAPLSGKALEYASEAFRINEQSTSPFAARHVERN